MSTDLRLIGIWWDGQKGRAKHDGVEAALRRAPVFEKSGRIDRIEFDPAMRVFEIALRSVDARRAMEPREIDEANLWLIKEFSSPLRERIG